ncbi:MAG TPA: ECF subfamily RNA polymerase sigma factor, BldN family [Actinocrinis sp.]|nr:ECF subfamily RNA polymerase sigma factor, BldN family [Actinocrinis sp.]
MHRDVRVDTAGWSGLRAALAVISASAVPQPSTVPPQPAGSPPRPGSGRPAGPGPGPALPGECPESRSAAPRQNGRPAAFGPDDRSVQSGHAPLPGQYPGPYPDEPAEPEPGQYPAGRYAEEPYSEQQSAAGRYPGEEALGGEAATAAGSGHPDLAEVTDADVDADPAGPDPDHGGPTVPAQSAGPARAGSAPPDFSRPDAAQAESLRMLALVKLAQGGDGEAFGQLYDAYSDTVFRYVYYRVSSRQLAEDITSETFLRALRRIGTFTWQGRDFGAWLVTIARNLVADHFKSSRYRLEVPTGEMMDSNETECSPEDSVLSYLSNRALLDAVTQLNSQQQECVTLRFLHGLSVAETAKIMGKNDGAIKTLQYRAIRTLARLLPVDLR